MMEQKQRIDSRTSLNKVFHSVKMSERKSDDCSSTRLFIFSQTQRALSSLANRIDGASIHVRFIEVSLIEVTSIYTVRKVIKVNVFMLISQYVTR